MGYSTITGTAGQFEQERRQKIKQELDADMTDHTTQPDEKGLHSILERNAVAKPETETLDALRAAVPQYFDKDGSFLKARFDADLAASGTTESPDGHRLNLGPAHDYIFVFAKCMRPGISIFNKLPLSDERSMQYKNPDNDPRGDWASVDITGQTGHAAESQFYEITTPSGLKLVPPAGILMS